MDRHKLRLRHEDALLLLALGGGFPGVCMGVVYILRSGLPEGLEIASIAALGACWLGCAMAVRERAAFRWRTMSSMLGAIREGDYSIRARVKTVDDSVNEALNELNLLGESLRERRLEKLEATALLTKVLEEIDAAIFIFDEAGGLRMVNRAGARLIGKTPASASAAGLGLEDLLSGEHATSIDREFPGAAGRWAVRHTTFREGGRPHRLLVLSDVTRELREEELQAWQRLVRVLGHELNNSLAPVQSIAHTMAALVRSDPLPCDWRQDVIEGLAVIANRSESLSRFVGSYARLAKLPKPNLVPVELGSCVERVLALRKWERLRLAGGPKVTVMADADQVEQLLINLLQNASDAVMKTGGGIELAWQVAGGRVELRVEDEGEGLANPDNLFVPFFSTKPGGSGIGLVLSRKIADGHHGSVTLENRAGARGSVARFVLPCYS